MTPASDSTLLYETISRVYSSHTDRPSINPAWLATETMVEIGFPRALHPLGYLGCHLQLRQMARQFCRKHFDPTEVAENDLFPETLQQRYPQVSPNVDADPEYVLLNLLCEADVDFNVARLRKEARAKLRHADALEAWGLRKFGRAA